MHPVQHSTMGFLFQQSQMHDHIRPDLEMENKTCSLISSPLFTCNGRYVWFSRQISKERSNLQSLSTTVLHIPHFQVSKTRWRVQTFSRPLLTKQIYLRSVQDANSFKTLSLPTQRGILCQNLFPTLFFTALYIRSFTNSWPSRWLEKLTSSELCRSACP